MLGISLNTLVRGLMDWTVRDNQYASYYKPSAGLNITKEFTSEMREHGTQQGKKKKRVSRDIIVKCLMKEFAVLCRAFVSFNT